MRLWRVVRQKDCPRLLMKPPFVILSSAKDLVKGRVYGQVRFFTEFTMCSPKRSE